MIRCAARLPEESRQDDEGPGVGLSWPVCQKEGQLEGVRLQIRVQPRAKRDRVELTQGSKLKVYVTAAPEGGKANGAAIALLAADLGVGKSSIRILRGFKARDKVLVVEGLDEATLKARLGAGGSGRLSAG